MDDIIRMKVSIPTDDDGFSLLKCHLCGEYFKLSPKDYEDDKVLEIFCPNCGLISENYFSEDVINLASVMAKNEALDMIYKEMKKWEHEINNVFISFKVGEKPNHEYESPIRSIVDALSIIHYQCCKKDAKIKPILKISGSYCPFCGVKNFGIE